MKVKSLVPGVGLRRLLRTRRITSVRVFFAKNIDFERYRDLSPICETEAEVLEFSGLQVTWSDGRGHVLGNMIDGHVEGNFQRAT
jgi:hypothetical protein